MGMIILVGGTKGGGGKTTTAVNLSIALAVKEQEPNAVFMMDVDVQGSALNWIGTRMTNQLLPEIKCAKRNPQDSSGVLVDSIRKLAETYKYVVVDSGGYDGPSFRAALAVCDLLVFPIQPTQLDLWEIEKTVELVELAKGFNPDIKMLAVLSRCSTLPSSTDADSAREFIASHGIPIANAVVKNRVSYQRCASEGKGVVEFNDKKAKEEIEALTLEVINYAK